MRRPVLYALAALAAAGAVYAGTQLASRALQPGFQSFTVTPTLGEAQESGALLATYRAVPSDTAVAVPAAEAVYAVRPRRKALGALLQTTYVEADAAQLVVRLDASDGAFRLAFDDGAGVRIRPDGTAERGPFDDGTTAAGDLVQCCFAMRAAPPERFWLERDGERLITFVREDG